MDNYVDYTSYSPFIEEGRIANDLNDFDIALQLQLEENPRFLESSTDHLTGDWAVRDYPVNNHSSSLWEGDYGYFSDETSKEDPIQSEQSMDIDQDPTLSDFSSNTVDFSPSAIINGQDSEYKKSLEIDKIRELKEKKDDFLIEREFNIRRKYRQKLYEKYSDNNEGENDYDIAFKFPFSVRKNYSFSKKDTVEQLYEFAGGQMVNSPLLKIKKFSLVLPFPKKILDDKTITLESLNLYPRSVVLVTEV